MAKQSDIPEKGEVARSSYAPVFNDESRKAKVESKAGGASISPLTAIGRLESELELRRVGFAATGEDVPLPAERNTRSE